MQFHHDFIECHDHSVEFHRMLHDFMRISLNLKTPKTRILKMIQTKKRDFPILDKKVKLLTGKLMDIGLRPTGESITTHMRKLLRLFSCGTMRQSMFGVIYLDVCFSLALFSGYRSTWFQFLILTNKVLQIWQSQWLPAALVVFKNLWVHWITRPHHVKDFPKKVSWIICSVASNFSSIQK